MQPHRLAIVALLFATVAAAQEQEAEPAAVPFPPPAETKSEALPEASGVLLDRIVAVVNDGIVLQSELDERVAQVDARMRERGVPPLPRDQVNEQVLERLIIFEAQKQRADRLGVTVDDESLNRMLATVAQRNGITFDQLPQALAAQGVDYQAYREQSRREIMIEQLRARDVYSRVQITPSEVENYLRKLSGQDDSIEYHLSHILVGLSPGANVWYGPRP